MCERGEEDELGEVSHPLQRVVSGKEKSDESVWG